MSISTIFPCLTVKPMTETGRPPGATTTPAAPFTSAGCTNGESRAKVSACSATARAPRTTAGMPTGTMPMSAWSTTSGSSTATSAAKWPSRAAAKNASTTARWRDRSASGTFAPCTRRRARLATCRAVVGERPTMAAISSKGTANMSCSTNASRSAGASVSKTTSSAHPSHPLCLSGPHPSARLTPGPGAPPGDDVLGAALRPHLTAELADAAAEAAHECRDVRAAGIGTPPACRLGPPEELVGGRVERFEGGAQPGKGARPAGHHLGQRPVGCVELAHPAQVGEERLTGVAGGQRLVRPCGEPVDLVGRKLLEQRPLSREVAGDNADPHAPP